MIAPLFDFKAQHSQPLHRAFWGIRARTFSKKNPCVKPDLPWRYTLSPLFPGALMLGLKGLRHLLSLFTHRIVFARPRDEPRAESRCVSWAVPTEGTCAGRRSCSHQTVQPRHPIPFYGAHTSSKSPQGRGNQQRKNTLINTESAACSWSIHGSKFKQSFGNYGGWFHYVY